MSFTPTPKANLDQLNNDLYDFTRKLRLKYHFRGFNNTDISLVKLPSKFTPSPNEDPELEKIIDKIEHLTVKKIKKEKHNNMSIPLRDALQSLKAKVENQEVIIKSADKGDITVVMSQDYYRNMCLQELSKTEHYRWIPTDPSTTVKSTVDNFATKYRPMLTEKEYEYLTNREYKMANFYTLPKLHKSEHLKDFLNQGLEYVHIPGYDQVIEGRPIVGGPCYFTCGLSEMVDIILKPIVYQIPHILRDSFDLIEKCEKSIQDNTLLGSSDIKSLYTNLTTELVTDSIHYWVNKYKDSIPLLQRFSLAFIIEAIQIILQNNFFFFDDAHLEQTLGFAMGTKSAVQCANLAVAYLEVKMFALLPTIYPQDFVDFIVRNYFRFLDDIFHKWLANFDITQFYQIFDGLDPKLKFLFSNLSKVCNVLDITFKAEGEKLIMDVYHKPTDSFNFLNYRSCHPKHTKDNIALSLGKRIVNIVSGDYGPRLEELKFHLMERGHPEPTINFAFSKIFQPKISNPSDSSDILVFTETFNPRHQFDHKIVSTLLDSVTGQEMKKAFSNCKIIMGSRQPKCLRNHLIHSKFSSVPRIVVSKQVGLTSCRKCIYHEDGYIKECRYFSFGRRDKFKWTYTRYFDCNAKNVIYIVTCNYCWKFYIGETSDFKQRVSKHKSDVIHPENSFCKKLMHHLRLCSNFYEPYFNIYPIYYVDDQSRRKFIEKRFIHYFQPPLNSDS